ncbi:GATA-type domain-containing protein, partial [Meloidogyne graminicola]
MYKLTTPKIKPIYVDVKINEEWKEKREFNYLNNIEEEEEPFILRTKENCSGDIFLQNITKLLRKIKKDNETNIFKENKTLNNKIEYYKKNLLKNYWTQINLISYKIELLNKYKRINKIEELKELENKIILIGKQITIENDQNPINKIYKIANNEHKTDDKERKKLAMDLNLKIKQL